MTAPGSISGLLASMRQIQTRIVNDTATVEGLRKTILSRIDQGSSTGDPITDIILRYGPPQETAYLEDNLRRIDDQIRQSARQFVILEITPPRARFREPEMPIITLCSVVSTDIYSLALRYVKGPDDQYGIQIPTMDSQQIILTKPMIDELIRADQPRLSGLMDTGGSFRLVIGLKDVQFFLSPDYDGSIEVKFNREQRMLPIAAHLAHLAELHGVQLDGYEELRAMLEAGKHADQTYAARY